MNNILLNRFPISIKIDEMEYQINTDYRNCLKIILAFEDNELNIGDKYEILLKRLYKKIPNNLKEAIEKGIAFLDCNGNIKSKENEDFKKRVYSFQKDGRFIYSSLKQTHNIDLEEIEFLHWWKLVFLFMDIDKDCMFSQLLQFRKKVADGKLNNEEKKLYLEMRELIDLDYVEDEELEDSELMNFWNGGEAKE